MMYSVGDKVKIVDAMEPSWLGDEAEITGIVCNNPICYTLNIGGGHWLHSSLEKIKENEDTRTREIKFRTWDENRQFMFMPNVIDLFIDFVGNVYSTSALGNVIPIKHLKPLQYTGLKDKNGKEIYEGDIVTYGAWDRDIDQDWRHSPAVVEYKDKEAAFHLTRSCNIRLGSGLRELEVLGNIYENPELLKTL